MEISEELIAKINAIRERREDRGFTRAEAEQAAGKLTELLTRYNISLLDLDKYADAKGNTLSEQMFTMSARSNWRRELMNQIARANSCRIILYPKIKDVLIVGYEHNVIVTVDTYVWLESIFEDLVKKERDMLKMRTWEILPPVTWDDYFYREDKNLMYESSRKELMRNRQRWSNSFRFGMVAGMADAMEKARTKVRRDVGENKWALIPIMEKDVDDRVLEITGGNRSKRKVSLSRAAQSHGYEVGKSINTDRQVQSGEVNPALVG